MIETLIRFFEDIPSWQRTLILSGGLLIFWILEGIVPILRMQYNRTRHLSVNLFFTLTTLLVNFTFAVLIVRASDWSVQTGFGVLQMIPMHLWLQLVVGLLVMDLISAYVIHWIQHKVYWMWRFHVVHHSDMHIDTSTALRHHPGESVFRAAFTTLAVLIAGAPIWLVMLYQSLSAFASQFNHANLRLPESIDRMLSYVLVTPRMHRVHHHHTQPYTDTNYGNIFSIWDRLFGTFARLRQSDIIFGLNVYHKSDENVIDLMKVPVDGSSYKRVEGENVRT